MNGNPTVLIQTERHRWLSFSEPIRTFTTPRLADVMPILEELSELTSKGLYAAGFISYEAAPAMDPALLVHPPSDDFPLLWFGLYREPLVLKEPPSAAAEQPGMFAPAITRAAYLAAIATIRDLIHRGDTYQVNYTFPLVAPFHGDPYFLFHSLIQAQPSECAAYVEIPGHALCSASPELFFAREPDGRIFSRPMKGTAPRGLTSEQDLRNIQQLRDSEKARSENIMIVDMIRNDLGRIAESGSVRVTRTFDIERYPTLLQMTSTVEGTTHAAVSDILKALFPCASITGAPKVRTMQIIRDLESGPRGIYTGSIGYFGPGPVARFNVAIRTVHVDQQRHEAQYGTGSGIVWDSEAGDEYDECLTKANVLSTSAPPEFSLLETMLWEPGSGIFLLERHMKRLGDSADYYVIPADLPAIRHQLEQATKSLSFKPHKIRLLVDQHGGTHIECTALPESATASPVLLRRASHAVDSHNVFLYHKTTHRADYDDARKDLAPNEDAILFNEHGHITESTIANIVIERNGRKLTPPIAAGLLPGTFRAELLEQGQIAEATLTWDDLLHADNLWLINSVRRWIPATL